MRLRSPKDPKDIHELPLCWALWQDATSLGRWRSLEDARRAGTTTTCQTVGWLVKATRTEISLAQSIGEGGDVNDLMVIPRSEVKELRELRRRRRTHG